MKICTKCRIGKPLSAFPSNRRARDGLNWWCGDCKRDYARRWNAEHHEKRLEYSRRFWRENRALPRLAKVCEFCGEEFTTARTDQRFCQKSCSRKWHSRHDPSRKAWTDRRRANYHKRRALKRAAPVSVPVLLEEIRERDRNRCGLCGKSVNGKVWPHPLSASLDHIVPLSAGGAHDPANVQLAHLGCNVSKGSRGGGEQLRIL